ncbi:hypothetical protein [Sporosarcina sp.]|uniref:hypothetical protein n=1 Tax=Sporosarcina sp. TaxID=49982 RepID=UPI00261019D8|nr:hypothetical protein [Sporosarcina sp.]
MLLLQLTVHLIILTEQLPIEATVNTLSTHFLDKPQAMEEMSTGIQNVAEIAASIAGNSDYISERVSERRTCGGKEMDW